MASINLGEVKETRFKLLEPEGRVWDRLKRALDLSKNVSDPAKNVFRLSNSSLKNERPHLKNYLKQ